MLQHGAAGFTYLPKEVMIRILIALKNPSFLAGFEPANLGTGSLNREKKNPCTGRQYGSQPRYRRLSHKIGINNWKKAVQDRKRWKRLLAEAKIRQGL
jgi:hypothetical protein